MDEETKNKIKNLGKSPENKYIQIRNLDNSFREIVDNIRKWKWRDWFKIRYLWVLWISEDIEIKKDNIYSNNYKFYLDLPEKNINKILICPKCQNWNITLKKFLSINKVDYNDIFDINFLRCDNNKCDFITNQWIEILTNRIIDEKINSAEQKSEELKNKHEADEKLEEVVSEKEKLENENEKIKKYIKDNSFLNIIKTVFQEKPVKMSLVFVIFSMTIIFSFWSLILNTDHQFKINIQEWVFEISKNEPK